MNYTGYTTQDMPLKALDGEQFTAPAAVEHAAPGLVITPALGATKDGRLGFLGGWLLLHTSTGYSLNGEDAPHACLDCIRAYAVAVAASGVDWTRTQPEISTHFLTDTAIADRLRKANRELGRCPGADCGDNPWTSLLANIEPAPN